MAERLSGKVIVVAGAGGIGDGIAKGLADEGAIVVVGDIVADLAAKVVDEISATGGTALAAQFNGVDFR